jgi:hypothetical protein
MDERILLKLAPDFKKFWIRVPLVLYPWSSGLLSAITTSSIKGVAEMMKSEDILNILTHPLPYICLLICFVCIIGQLYTLNTGFKYYNQLEVVPIYQSSVIINNFLCGGVIFDEFDYYNWWQILLINVGSLICISGILIIAKKYAFISRDKSERFAYDQDMKELKVVIQTNLGGGGGMPN